MAGARACFKEVNMQEEYFHRVEHIFQSVIALPPDLREAYLDKACASDLQLRVEITSLLRHHENLHGLLNDAPMGRFRHIDEAPPPGEMISKIIGPYKVVRLLGIGGMSEVWLAEHTRLGRKDALKLLPAGLDHAAELALRLLREARAASALNHPNIITVYEADIEHDPPYIASELVNGLSLRDRMLQGPMPLSEIIEIACQIGTGLAVAHAAGLVHRDIKPENVMIRADGLVKILDFGIAHRLVSSEDGGTVSTLTPAGALIGTLAYVSPEQARGQPVDPGTDIWSLGIVLYEMLAGNRPFTGENTVDVITSILTTEPELEFKRPVPAALQQVLVSALQKKRGDRYESVDQVVLELRQIGSNIGLLPRVSIHWKYAYLKWLLAVLLIISLLKLAVLIGNGRKQVTTGDFRTDRMLKLTTGGKAVDAVLSSDERYVLYVIDEGGQQSVRLLQVDTGADVERIPPAEVEYYGLTIAPDNNRFYYTLDQHREARALYGAPLLGGTARKIIDDIDSPADFSPDGRHIVFFRSNPALDKSELHIADANGSHEREVAVRSISRAFSYDGGAWTPDGKHVICAAAYDDDSRFSLIEVEVESGKQRHLSRPEWRWIGRLSFLSDGRTIVFPGAQATFDPQLFQLSYNNGVWTPLTNDLASYANAFGTATSIVAVQEDTHSAVWVMTPSVRTNTLRRITPAAGRYYHVIWSSDGTLLSDSAVERSVHIVRLHLDGSIEQLTEGPYIDWEPSPSRDGKRIAFASNRSGSWRVWGIEADGSSPRELVDAVGQYTSPSFAGDDSVIFTGVAAGQYHLWRARVETHNVSQLFAFQARYPTVSPTGRYIVCDVKDGSAISKWRVAIVDLKAQKIVRDFVDIPLGSSSSIQWRPDETAVTYVITRDGLSNIWERSVIGGSPKQLTHFDENMIFSFGWSSTGRDLALVRGVGASDVVLFRGRK
jgi:serine/threonine protein kinase/Tol biopolymer transport system component